MAAAWVGGITSAIMGTDRIEMAPPKPPLAMPYNITAGILAR